MRAHTHSCWCCSSWCLWCCCHKHIKVYVYWNRSRDNNSNNNIGGNNGNDLDQSHLMQICDLTGITGVRREIFRAAEHGRKTCRRCFFIFSWQLFCLCLSLSPSLCLSTSIYCNLQARLRIAIGTPNRCWPPWMLMTLNGLGKLWLRLPRRNIPRPKRSNNTYDTVQLKTSAILFSNARMLYGIIKCTAFRYIDIMKRTMTDMMFYLLFLLTSKLIFICLQVTSSSLTISC